MGDTPEPEPPRPYPKMVQGRIVEDEAEHRRVFPEDFPEDASA